MATLSSTRNMFNFILVLYLLGFFVMMTRWKRAETEDSSHSESYSERQRRDDHFIKLSLLRHSPVDEKASSEAVLNNDVLKVDQKIPILMNNSAKSPETEESSPQGKKNKSRKRGSLKKTVKKTPATNKAKKPHLAPKPSVKDIASVSQTVKKGQSGENPAKAFPKGQVGENKVKTVSKGHTGENLVKVSNKGQAGENPVKASSKGQAADNLVKASDMGQVGENPVKGIQKKSANRRKQFKKKLTSAKEPDERTKWETEQERRRNTLRQACSNHDNYGQQSHISEIIKSHKRSLWPFIVEDKYRLLYTFVSKVGSTNWKRAFLVLKGKYKTVEDVPGQLAHSPLLVKLSSLPEEGIQRRLDNYTNFIFVRHPFARVLSAYRSKFLQPNAAFQKKTGVRIIKMYRQNATKESLATGSDVTFPEFVRYLVNAKVVNFDGHWQPIYKMVLPCAMRFDYIGKLETGENDAKYILQKAKVDHLIHFMETKRNVSHDAAIFEHYYSQIPSADLVKLYKIYEPDFQLFGYEVADNMKTHFKWV
ncbi:carbohydrate sulfotransferase 14-like [Acanthaster planci]|uniref:Carbohydrate sulfotransferase n=1 Tax=Acanthaster planci TaxID=133434 RepID=A0A8B7ZX67_ACAPL|nr:carbohydrate sulfotransferase 14-like [Acanthaster planci]